MFPTRRGDCRMTIESPPAESDFGCQLCPYRCPKRADLLYHQSMEHGQLVGQSFFIQNPRNSNVEWNKIAGKATEGGKFECPECGQVYAKSASLKTHLLSHTGELPYRCVHCGRHFSCESQRLAHIQQLHQTLRPSSSDDSGKTG